MSPILQRVLVLSGRSHVRLHLDVLADLHEEGLRRPRRRYSRFEDAP